MIWQCIPYGTIRGGRSPLSDKLKIGIIGLGNMGYNYGAIDDKRPQPASHFHGYLAYKDKCEIVATCDIIPDRIKIETGAPCRGYTNYKDMLKAEKLDVISLVTPDITHEQIGSNCIEARPKVILWEKPFCLNLRNGEMLIRMAEVFNVKIAVNHQRRSDPIWNTLPEIFANNGYGELVRAVAKCYGDGLRQWVHMADLVNMFEIKDKTIFVPLQNVNYVLFEMEFYFKDHAVRVVDNGRGIIHMTAIPSQYYGINYKNLIKELKCTTFTSNELVVTMRDVIADVLECASNENKQPNCNAHHGLEAVKLCREWIDQYSIKEAIPSA